MSEFKVGDRVRLVGELEDGYPAGMIGTVVEIRGSLVHPVRVQFPPDADGEPYPISESEIELATEEGSDPVSHPSHYQHPSGIEVIDITRHESFLRGNVIKYVLRAPYKGAELQDLRKARQYLDWEIDRVEAEGD